jgi:hypothetical protein
VEVEGEVGDGNSMLAIGDAIRDRASFDQIILSTLPAGLSKWLRLDLPHRVAASSSIPMTHVASEPAHVGASRR